MPKVTELKVSDAMEKEIVTVKPNITIDQVAKRMRELREVCAVVVKDKKPLGIVTESDIIRKIVSKDKRPSEVEVKDVMSSPIYTVKPKELVKEVGKLMMNKKVRQLPVVTEGKLVGIIYSRNIANVYPDVIEILEERLEGLKSIKMPKFGKRPLSGYCEGCGRWSEDLVEVGGKMLCRECRE